MLGDSDKRELAMPQEYSGQDKRLSWRMKKRKRITNNCANMQLLISQSNASGISTHS
jgi:hypothetical protein